jgi:hypothetical protein
VRGIDNPLVAKWIATEMGLDGDGFGGRAWRRFDPRWRATVEPEPAAIRLDVFGPMHHVLPPRHILEPGRKTRGVDLRSCSEPEMLSDILIGGNLLQLKVKFRPYFRDRYLQIDFDFAEKISKA